jgi:G:T-mismatch repair DNA endonuclease (very short patch repair protein)
MYKAPNKNKDQHWLLFDNDHYHLITNINGFLAVNHFCNKCFQCFEHKATYEKHECCSECEKPKRKINRNDHRTDKDLPHFLKSKFCNGSKEELNNKLQDKEDETKIEEITYNHSHPRYISFDYETDTHTLTHIPNHVEVDVLQIDEHLTHEYDKCLIDRKSFPGYGCEDAFCDWLFTKENQNSTVIAHNGSGYDFKFILKWCISKGMTPDSYVRQGSRITYMRFNKFQLRFVDSYNFFLEKLSKLSKTYDIDTIKGHFPHHFNTPENQDYVGCIPCEDMFGVQESWIQIEYETRNFLPWYNQQQDVTDWNFKEEMVKYCRADVELLSKAILKFRKMFMDSLDVDPFRYVTLASLCMSIYSNKFMPERTIVGNSNTKTSIACKEWLLHLNDKNIVPEVPICVDKRRFSKSFDCHKNKVESKTYFSGKHNFVVDGFDKVNKVIKEFYGCYWHGCRKCHPEEIAKYDSTMERKNMLEEAGYKVECIWECEWNKEQSYTREQDRVRRTSQESTYQCERCPIWWANRRLQIVFQVQRKTEGLLLLTWFPYTQRSMP